MAVGQAKTMFDLSFRPAAYDTDPNALSALVDSIQEQARREIAAVMLAEGRISELNEMVFAERLPVDQRQAWGRLDPRFMGGEYLPAMQDDEIEIARIVLQSVTQDVVSIRARRSDGGWYYRFVDEYENDYTIRYRHIAEPLTMGELVELIDTVECNEVGFVVPTLDMNLEYGADDPEELREFVSVSSLFYPDLGRYYEQVVDDWIVARTAEGKTDHEEI